MHSKWVVLVVAIALSACTEKPGPSTPATPPVPPLPFYGEHDVEFVRRESGEVVPDSSYYTIPKFSFINQDGKEFSHRDIEGHIVVADFFFTTCESICPVMSGQMSRIQERLKQDGLLGDVILISHSVKPEEDTPEVLKVYGEARGADFRYWNFLTGRADDIYLQAEVGYMLSAFPSDTAQGGVFHTDQFTLLDRGMHIRGYYDGTSSRSVDQLYDDIKRLLHEQPANERP